MKILIKTIFMLFLILGSRVYAAGAPSPAVSPGAPGPGPSGGSYAIPVYIISKTDKITIDKTNAIPVYVVKSTDKGYGGEDGVFVTNVYIEHPNSKEAQKDPDGPPQAVYIEEIDPLTVKEHSFFGPAEAMPIKIVHHHIIQSES